MGDLPDMIVTESEQSAAVCDVSVAIIMRTKDRPLLLARALASVLSQRFVGWTLWVVNDGGSRDRLQKALVPFLDQFGSRLQVIHNDVSLGMEAASNRAIAASRSRYLVVHDDDDSWHPEFLSETVSFLDREENARYGGVVTWSEKVQERIDGDEIHALSREPYNHWYDHIDMYRLLGGNVFAPISLLFRRLTYEQVGPFREDMPVLGDWEFNIRSILLSDIAVLPKQLAYYHHRVDLDGGDIYSNSISSAQIIHKRIDAEIRNDLLRRYLSERPADLGNLAAISRDFVRTGERLNEVETYLTHQSGRVIERLNQVETYLAYRGGALIERLNEVESYLAHQHAPVIERLNQVESYLAHQHAPVIERLNRLDHHLSMLRSDLGPAIAAGRVARLALRPARYLWRRLLTLRRVIGRPRGPT